MLDYKAMYFSLLNSITDAIEVLKAAQLKGEDQFVTSKECDIEVIKKLPIDKTV